VVVAAFAGFFFFAPIVSCATRASAATSSKCKSAGFTGRVFVIDAEDLLLVAGNQ
jgi:hypothetical protein